jgi:hypothetical protein
MSVYSPPPLDELPEIAGRCDGLDGYELFGWAWRPDAPDVHVEIELWVEGALAVRSIANIGRGDLAEAGIGEGDHGWRMRLALYPDRPGPQRVEVRAAGGGPLQDATFDLTYDPSLAPPPPEPPPPEPPPEETEPVKPIAERWGVCDGRAGGTVHGWAWRPGSPEQRVEVEQWVDGALVAQTVADLLRPDLAGEGLGDGRYGWRMQLALDPEEIGPQSVELRVRGGGALDRGGFDISVDQLEDAGEEAQAPLSPIVGRCDGLKGSALHGWAWNPKQPDVPVEIELWVDGVYEAGCVADQFRPDLRAGGVGHGRHAWRLPVDLDRVERQPMNVEVRVKGGPPLSGGAFLLENDLSLGDPANAPLRPFVTAALQAAPRPADAQGRGDRVFLLYAPDPTPAGPFWSGEHDDYPGALKRFAPVLARLGEVIEVDSVEAARAICAERRKRGAACLLFCFAPPRQAPLDAPCPIIPVFAWAFPNIPIGTWDGDLRSDWRAVLRLAGRAITFSRFAAEATKAALGADFPVVSILPPARELDETAAAPAGRRRTIRLAGVIFDSRDYVFDPETPTLPPRVWNGDEAEGASRDVVIEGVLFVSIFDFGDARKSWSDLITAFAAAHRDNPDAVLLLRFGEPDARWMPALYRWLSLLPPFKCRIVAMRGELDEADERTLIAASNWWATASNADGLCLPLQDFLAAGRPAIAPSHSALGDLVDADNALLVASDEEAWRWPDEGWDEDWSWTQHPDDVGPTTRARVSWAGLVEAFAEAYRLSTAAPKTYARMAAASRSQMQSHCGPDAAAEALAAFLATDDRPAAAHGPSPLLRELAAG